MVKRLPHKPGDPSSIPATYVKVEGESSPNKALLEPPRVCCAMGASAHTPQVHMMMKLIRVGGQKAEKRV